MSRIRNEGLAFLHEEDGAALAEYGILIGFIAIVAIVAVTFFGQTVRSKFSEYANHMT